VALSFSVFLPSYSAEADTTYGVTNNAINDGLTWSPVDVLPDFSSPNVSLQVNGVTYYYVMSKDPTSDATVYVRNEDAVNGGYVFEEVDDWSGLPGNSILKNFRFAGIPGEQWGEGSITVDGDGTVSDASVIYLYKMDITEPDIICTNPIISPECPGFLDALYKYLEGLEYVDPEDEFYEYWVEIQEDREVETEKDEIEVVEENEEDNLEKSLKTDPDVGGFIDGFVQQGLLEQLANDPLIQPYYVVEYPETIVLQDTLQLEDTVLPDNNRAMRQLANDAKHYSMVRSQYDRENITGE
jgi:hypothetical protein